LIFINLPFVDPMALFSFTNRIKTAAKYSAAGALHWKRRLAAEAGAEGVATDGGGNVYIAGWTLGSLGGPKQGGEGAVVAKYSTRP
jgi:Beta-propeller repeat